MAFSIVLECNVETYGVLAHGRVAGGGAHFRVESRELGDGEEVLSGSIYPDLADADLAGQAFRKGVTQCHVLEFQVVTLAKMQG